MPKQTSAIYICINVIEFAYNINVCFYFFGINIGGDYCYIQMFVASPSSCIHFDISKISPIKSCAKFLSIITSIL